MKKKNKFISKYRKDGYFLTQNLFNNEDIQMKNLDALREELDQEQKK